MNITVNHNDMEKALNVLKTLNHPVRLSILCNLMQRKEMSAGEIVKQEKNYASQSQVSQYLKMLRDNNYVTARKEGLHVYYSISSPEVSALIEKMHELFCHNDIICN